MQLRGNYYSNFVTFAKIVLPLAAIGLLASLFLLAGSPEETQRIPYSDVELNEIINQQRLASPNYQSVLTDGAALSVVADRAAPDPDIEGRINANEIVARITDVDGLRTLLTAPKGVHDETAQTATVLGGVLIRRSDGYQARTPGMVVQTDGRRAESMGQFLVEGPGVFLDAGKATFIQGEAGTGSEVVVFTEGVKLIYDPRTVSER